ncbi:MAG TPA: potassium channel family protein [Allosphingosinicella sp.]|jgi:voltage-gated potassium channel|nr:potassium channel family protein [Allosphingosinicella sp.]
MKNLRAATDTLKELAALYAALILGCTLLFMWLEPYDFSTSLYWAGATATSTGYGDITPKSVGGQMLAFVLMHVSVFCVAPLIIVRLIDRLNENRDAFTHEEQIHILEGLARIEAELGRMRAEAAER